MPSAHGSLLPPMVLMLLGASMTPVRSTSPLLTTVLLQHVDYSVLHSVLTHFLFDQILKYYKLAKLQKARSQLSAILTLGKMRQKIVDCGLVWAI